jgi:hypothetical protein
MGMAGVRRCFMSAHHPGHLGWKRRRIKDLSLMFHSADNLPPICAETARCWRLGLPCHAGASVSVDHDAKATLSTNVNVPMRT